MANQRHWQPGRLWERVRSQSQFALQTGALQSIDTDYTLIEDGGITFVVRILANLNRKENAKKAQKSMKTSEGKPFNPFLPYEEDLYVTDLSDTHLCLLNKFNVVDHHLLIITRAFVAQENWLNLADFVALWTCLTEVDGLGFYNGGAKAGASQPHKHLQLIPLPLLPEDSALPIEAAIQTASFTAGIGQSPQLRFEHAIAPLDISLESSPEIGGNAFLSAYHQLLECLQIGDPSHQWQGLQHTAYNLLCTRHWLMVIPRTQESHCSISVNSLGFAGSLLVKNLARLETLKTIGPMQLLEAVAKTPVNQ